MIACANNSSKNNLNNAKIIKIGVIEPQTGIYSGGGIQELSGIRYANQVYNVINIGGEEYKIELEEIDNESNKKNAIDVSKKIVDKNISAVIGSYGSDLSIAMGEYLKDAKIPAIACSNTNPQVTNGNEYYFRVCPTDPLQAVVMSCYLANSGYQNVAVITQTDSMYSNDLGKFFVKACEKNNIDVVLQERIQDIENEMPNVLEDIKAKQPQFIYVPVEIDIAAFIINEIGKQEISCLIGSGVAWENKSIIESLGNNTNDIVVTSFYEHNSQILKDEKKDIVVENISLNDFSEYLLSNFNIENIYSTSALGYDAYLAIYKAIELAQSTNRSDILEALKKIRFDGITGKVSFDIDRNVNINNKNFYIKRLENNGFIVDDKIELNN